MNDVILDWQTSQNIILYYSFISKIWKMSMGSKVACNFLTT